jgi:hypothetical protein
MTTTVEEIDYQKLCRCVRHDDIDTFQNFYEKFGNKLKCDRKSSYHIIYFVIQSYSRHIINYLIEKDPSCINVQTLLGFTPLIYSLRVGWDDFAKLLLEYGADPTIKDTYSNDALYYANLYTYSEIVEIIESKLLIATKSSNKM